VRSVSTAGVILSKGAASNFETIADISVLHAEVFSLDTQYFEVEKSERAMIILLGNSNVLSAGEERKGKPPIDLLLDARNDRE
jgi:hypothetical protein